MSLIDVPEGDTHEHAVLLVIYDRLNQATQQLLDTAQRRAEDANLNPTLLDMLHLADRAVAPLGSYQGWVLGEPYQDKRVVHHAALLNKDPDHPEWAEVGRPTRRDLSVWLDDNYHHVSALQAGYDIQTEIFKMLPGITIDALAEYLPAKTEVVKSLTEDEADIVRTNVMDRIDDWDEHCNGPNYSRSGDEDGPFVRCEDCYVELSWLNAHSVGTSKELCIPCSGE